MQINSRILIFLTIFLFLFNLVPAPGMGCAIDDDADSYCDISTCIDLQNIDPSSGMDYELVNDVDCGVDTNNSEGTLWNGGDGFEPIGTDSTPFITNFNGNNYTISNLYINRPTEDNVGLFGYVEGSISNLGLVNVNVSGQANVGALAGFLDIGSVSNCYSTGFVYGFGDGMSGGGNKIGGLIGEFWGSLMSNSYSTADVNGYRQVGGLVGYHEYSSDPLDSNISYSYATGSVTGYSDMVGGLVGVTNDAYIFGSYATGDVNGGTWSGGLVGASDGGYISNSYAIGVVNGRGSWVGGLVGSLVNGNISNSYAIGEVISEDVSGGLIGVLFESDVNNCYSTGNVSGTTLIGNLGGFVGSVTSSTISNSYSTGSVSDIGSDNGGFTGYLFESEVSNSFWDVNTSEMLTSSSGVGKTTSEMKIVETFVDWDFDSVWLERDNNYPILDWQLIDNDSDGYYEITSCEKLENISNFPRLNYELVGDVDCSDTINWDYNMGHCSDILWDNQVDCESNWYTWYFDEGFEPIGSNEIPFTGNFNGNNFTINDLYINRTGTSYVGLFGYVEGDISNVNLIDANISGNLRVGILAGRSLGDINNSSVTGKVDGWSYVGGLAGGVLGNIYDSNSDVNVFSNDRGDYVGGLVGGTYGLIDNCHSSGTVVVTTIDNDGSVGGLVGVLGLGGFVNNSSSLSDVNGIFATGGLVGSSIGDINNSYATGIVFGVADYTGGLVGSLEGDINNSYSVGNVTQESGDLGGYTGGLVGVSSVSSGKGGIYTSYATGNVTGILRVGGLVGGTDSIVSECYALGEVTGSSEKVGGLIGGLSGAVEKSFAIGRVTSTGNSVGGLIGFALNSTISECYSNNDLVSGEDNVGGLVGKMIGDLITDSYSWSNVSSIKNNIGGLVGYLEQSEGLSVYNSYSTGNVDGNSYVGGLVGFVHIDDILDSFSTSLITFNNSPYAGFVGNFSYRGPNLTNVYWNNYSEYSDELNCFSFTNEDPITIYSDENCVSIDDNVSYFYNPLNGPMPEWDFETVWIEIDNNYPIFRWAYDSDNDGKIDSIDPLWYNSTNVESSGLTTDLNILVDGENTDKSFDGLKEVVFSDGSNPLMDFNFNFDNNVLDLSKIIIEKSINGIVVDLNGQLQSDQNKTLYLTNNSFDSLCVKNAPITSISEISSTCTGANEYDFTTCLSGSYSTAGIDCTLTGGVIKVSNLRYSGILGVVDEEDDSESTSRSSSSSYVCYSSWDCNSWSDCVNGLQTRTCIDTRCNAKLGSPITEKSCVVEVEVIEEDNYPVDSNVVEIVKPIEDNVDVDTNVVEYPNIENDIVESNFDYSWIIIILVLLVLIGAVIVFKSKNKKK